MDYKMSAKAAIHTLGLALGKIDDPESDDEMIFHAQPVNNCDPAEESKDTIGLSY